MTEHVLSPDELEAALRAIGAERYHSRHPFHQLLHSGRLTKGQVQAWALNRYYYQARIPIKDAAVIARLPSPELRRMWRRRLEDQDGSEGQPGGVERWLVLCERLGLDRAYVESMAGLLPGTRFAVDAYLALVRDHSVLVAIASCLTELFAPTIIAERVAGMLAHYDFVTADTLAYFTPRLTQAPQDADFALAYVRDQALTLEDQRAVLAALRTKCDILWAMLDALHFAYVEPGLPSPGVFVPDCN